MSKQAPRGLGEGIKALFLPDEHSVGEPFWAVMHLGDNGQVTGEYFASRQPDGEGVIVPLFLSKADADKVVAERPEDRWAVRGLSQLQLLSYLQMHVEVGPKSTRFCPIEPGAKGGPFVTPAEVIAKYVDPEMVRQYVPPRH